MMSLMEKKGLVRKESVGKTLYGGVFKLTEEGQEAARHVSERSRIAVEIAGKDLTEENRQIFYEALDRIVENLRILAKDGIPEER